jgi:hypothetical protein
MGRVVKGRDARPGVLVWREIPGDGRRPAIVSHVQSRRVWVSFTDKPGGQAQVTAAALEPRPTGRTS